MAWLVSNDEQSIYEGLVHLLNNREEIELVKKIFVIINMIMFQ